MTWPPIAPRRIICGVASTLLALLLSACASGPIGPKGADAGPDASGWHDVPLPGKRRTAYRWEEHHGKRELVAWAEGSSSMFRRRIDKPADRLREVEFGWWVQALPDGADVSSADACDAAARLMFAFGGDMARLSPRNRLLFDLAHTLTGEAPPFATLVYVWDAKAPVGTVIVHPRSDRVRKIVVESGTGGLRQWRRYRRSLVDDYRLAFGEAPGPLQAVAVMTDGDNTRSLVNARYRDIQFR